jgi:hypothetical protein
MQLKPFIPALSSVAFMLVTVPVHAAPVEIRLEHATPAQAAEALQRATGLDVKINGGARRLVTLAMTAPRPELAIARVATALGGTWYIRLKVKNGRAPADAPVPQRQERLVNLGLNNVTATQAFSALARDLRMQLETEGELTGRVSFTAARLPASDVLDRVAAVAGVQWSLGYTIESPDVPPPPPPRPVMQEPSTPDETEPSVDPATPGSRRPAPRPRNGTPSILPPSVLSGPELRLQLKAGLSALVRASPDQRAGAVRDFMLDAERMMAMLRSLPTVERDTRLRLISTVVLPWRRLYDGLAPDVQREFQPVSEFMDRLHAATR